MRAQLTRLLLILTILILTSCRCQTDFLPKDENLPDSQVQASAHMWQGQYEYLTVDIRIMRTDSLFVKDFYVTPTIHNKKFFPEFIKYDMYSRSLEKNDKYKGKTNWKTYSEKIFDQLPTENRQTNIGEEFVKYSAFYNSTKPINFKEFSAEIIVVLIDKKGQEIKYKRKIDFYGKRDCRFSVH